MNTFVKLETFVAMEVLEKPENGKYGRFMLLLGRDRNTGY